MVCTQQLTVENYWKSIYKGWGSRTGRGRSSRFFTSGGQSIGASASASVLSMKIQVLFPLGLTGLISLLSKWLSRVFSNTTVQKHQFSALSLPYGSVLTSIHDYWKNRSFTIQTLVSKVTSLVLNMLSRFVLAFLPGNKCLLFHGWNHHLEPKKIKSATASTFSSSICHEVMRQNAMILIF